MQKDTLHQGLVRAQKGTQTDSLPQRWFQILLENWWLSVGAFQQLQRGFNDLVLLIRFIG